VIQINSDHVENPPYS